MNRLVSGAVVATVIAGSAVLVSGVAGATVPAGSLGSLRIEPASGDDLALMMSTTSGPCPVDPNDTRADQAIVGPVQADGTAPDATATFPDSNPFPITRINAAQFSTSQAFVQQFNNTFRDAAKVRGKTIQVGEYHLTTHCLDKNGLTVFGTFTGGLIFDTPTHYTVISNATSSTSPSPTPGSSPTPTPGATPTPTPGMTPTPSPTDSPTPSDSPIPTPSPTLDSTTTTPAPTMNDSGGTTTPSDTGGGTQPVASTGALASTGAPIAAMFLGGVILLAAGLVLVVWLRRPGRRP